MFSRTTPSSNLRNDKVPVGKPGGGMLKKKARDTILSVLNKKQTQEKQLIPERIDRPISWSTDGGADTNSSTVRPCSVVVKSSTTFSQDRGNCPVDATLEESELTSVKTHPVYKVIAKVIDEEKVNTIETKSTRSDKSSLPNETDGSLRRYLAPVSSGNTTQDKIIPNQTPQQSKPSVQTVSKSSYPVYPPYSNRASVKSEELHSPKKEVNFSFQVPVDTQSSMEKQEPKSPVWASSVNVWVPFQVMDGNEAVPVSQPQVFAPTRRAALTDTKEKTDSSRGDLGRKADVPRETVVTSTKDVEVKLAQTVSASSIGESIYRMPVTSTPVKALPGHSAVSSSPPRNRKQQRSWSEKTCLKSGPRESIGKPNMQSPSVFNSDLSPVENHTATRVEKPKKTASISELTFTIEEESPLNAVHDRVDGGLVKYSEVSTEKNSKQGVIDMTQSQRKPRSKSASAADSCRQVSTLENDDSKKIKPHKDSLMITRGRIGDNSKGNSSTLPGTGKKPTNSVEARPRRKSLPIVTEKMPLNKKDKSPNDSPKPSRRFGTARDIIKSRSSTSNSITAPSPGSSRKPRPQSDPLPGEKIPPARKTPSSVFSKFSSGKSKSAEIEALRLQLKQVEEEKESLRETLVDLESKLELIPVLEKEKLVTERQMNDVVQERDKIKLELKDSSESFKNLESEIEKLKIQQHLHLEEIEKGQVEMDAILDEKVALEKVKIGLDKDKKHFSEQVNSHLENVQKVTKEKEELLSDKRLLQFKLKGLLDELRRLRKTVLDLKADNLKLKNETLEHGTEFCNSLTCSAAALVREVEKQNFAQPLVCATSQTDSVAQNSQTTQTDIQNNSLLDKAGISNEEYDDLLDELEDNKDEIEALQKKLKKFEEENNELADKFEDAELELEKLKSERAREPKLLSDDEEGSKASFQLNCEECVKLRETLESLQTVFCIQQSKMEKMSEENELLETERDELKQESNYLKNVLSYRQDVQDVQTSFQKHKVKEVEQLESNLDDAETKVRELEDEVYRLHQEKRTLLMSILNMNDEDGAGDNAKENGERKQSNSSAEMPGSSEETLSSEVTSAEYTISYMKTDIPVKTEPEGSEATGDRDVENELDSNQESKEPNDHSKILQEENNNLKSSIDNKDVNVSQSARSEIFEGENKTMEDRINAESNLWDAQLKAVEEENINLRKSLLRVEEEKMALIKCLDLNSKFNYSSSAYTSAAASATEDEDREISKDASYIQSIVGKLRRLSMTSASEYESEIDKSGGEELEPGKRIAPEGSPPSSAKQPRDGSELARIVASLETDLGKLKKHMYKKDRDSGTTRRGPVKGPKGQMLRRHSTVHEINFAKTNLERVYKEKRHLKDEVDSLRRCLNVNSSHHTRRRFSVVETHHATIKTFDDLLQKSDLELRESNAKVARLELMKADTEEKLREAEALGEDLRKAVVISNNIATEERERAEKLEEEKSALLALVQQLTLSRMGGSLDEECNADSNHDRSFDEETEWKKDGRSSPNEFESDAKTPRRKRSNEKEWYKSSSRDRNGNIVGRQASSESAISNRDYEDDRQSRHSSFADVSEFDSDESLGSEEDNEEEEQQTEPQRGEHEDDEEYSTDDDST